MLPGGKCVRNVVIQEKNRFRNSVVLSSKVDEKLPFFFLSCARQQTFCGKFRSKQRIVDPADGLSVASGKDPCGVAERLENLA